MNTINARQAARRSAAPAPILPDDARRVTTGLLGDLQATYWARTKEAQAKIQAVIRMEREQAEASERVYQARGLDNDWGELAALDIKSKVLQRTIDAVKATATNLGEDANRARSDWESACQRYEELRAYLTGESSSVPRHHFETNRQLSESSIEAELARFLGHAVQWTDP
jgi:hypothetical protein